MLFGIFVGLVTGFAAIAFRELIYFFNLLLLERAWGWAEASLPYGRAALPVITGLGGLTVGLLVRFFAREAQGHGVPEVMAAVAVRGGIIRPRVAVVKALASAICIGSGGSAGREGPIVQIGSALGSAVGQLFHMSAQRVRTLVACGAAAGIAATFNAPIAGALFSLEIILGDFGFSNFAPVVAASVVGAEVGRWYFGNHPSLTVLHFQLRSIGEFPLYAVLGILAGFAGIIFTKVLYGQEDLYEKVLRAIPTPIRAMIGGVLVGTAGIFLPEVLGTGYGPIDAAVSGLLPLTFLALLFVGKMFATTTTLGSGGSGGIFAPSLFMGAMLGGAYGLAARFVFPGFTAQPGAYALVGMGAMVASATYAPLTAVVILFEMTDNYTIILPLMTACVVALIVARRLSDLSIYTRKIKRAGIHLREGKDVDVLKSINASDVMRHEFETIYGGMLFRDVMAFVQEARQNSFPVLDEKGELVGVISMQILRRWINERSFSDVVVAEELAKRNIVTVVETETLSTVWDKFERLDVESLPVVSSENPRRLVGLLFREDAYAAYTSKTVGLWAEKEEGETASPAGRE
ncbi:MAG: chloride channel protein [Candidatus Coatesbacteria bacterium]|nr:MAG: chloride channel protein [Candidatus Coatesbacteria bacterium]